jgi:hypothetical protein
MGRTKTLDGTAKIRGFILEDKHREVLKRWSDGKGLKSSNAALREILELIGRALDEL